MKSEKHKRGRKKLKVPTVKAGWNVQQVTVERVEQYRDTLADLVSPMYVSQAKIVDMMIAYVCEQIESGEMSVTDLLGLIAQKQNGK